jgi:hypothetical protein
VEQKKGSRYEHTQLCPPYFLIKVPKTNDGERIASSTNVAWKSGYPSAKN